MEIIILEKVSTEEEKVEEEDMTACRLTTRSMVGYRENYFFFFFFLPPRKVFGRYYFELRLGFCFIIRPEINFSEGYCSELCRLGYVILFFIFILLTLTLRLLLWFICRPPIKDIVLALAGLFELLFYLFIFIFCTARL